MAKGYRRVDRDQSFLLPPDMREWLPAEHPVWWVIEAVAGLDTSALHAQRRTGGVGRQGYDPDMLLTLLVWAWAQGQRSSRRIERLCQQDVAYRIICAGDAPDHTVIARFRQAAEPVMADLFAQVLALCAALGMVRVGTVALDGTKIAADASLEASLTEQGLVAALRRLGASAAAEHAAADAGEDARFGPGGRGDAVPDDPGTASGRARRVAQAIADQAAAAEPAVEPAADQVQPAEPAVRPAGAVESAAAAGRSPRARRAELARMERIGTALVKVRAEIQRRRGHRGDSAELRGRRGYRPTPAQLAAAHGRYEAAVEVQQQRIRLWEQAAAAGRPRRGPRPRPAEQIRKVQHTAQVRDRVLARMDLPDRTTVRERRAPTANTTDPDSAIQPTRNGWLQGYNCQAVTSSDGFIIATSVSANPSDNPTYQPMTDAAVAAVESLAGHRPDTFPTDHAQIGLILADAGYLSHDNLTAQGPDRLIATGKRRDVERQARDPEHPPPPDHDNPIEAMASRLRTPDGITAYRHRGHIAETTFGQTKHNNGFRRMTGRGLARAKADWTFNALVQNLLKTAPVTS